MKPRAQLRLEGQLARALEGLAAATAVLAARRDGEAWLRRQLEALKNREGVVITQERARLSDALAQVVAGLVELVAAGIASSAGRLRGRFPCERCGPRRSRSRREAEVAPG